MSEHDAAASARRNRRLIAERLGWPDGALEKCIALEEEFPCWAVFWTAGRTPWDPEPGYRASLRMQRHSSELYAATVEELRVLVAAVDEELPPAPTFGALTPLLRREPGA